MLDTRCSMLDQTQSDRASSIENTASLLLRSGMKFPVHSFQSLLIDVRIDLRCRNVGMAEHFLDDAKIGAVSQQVRREAVSQKVRVDVLFESGTARTLFHDLPDARCC